MTKEHKEVKLKALPDRMIYALDIGTRTVVGVVGSYSDEGFVVKAHVTIPHPERAMYDGQIHDIEKVVKIVKRVTETLEEQTGYSLRRVALAAAGRALKTERSQVIKSIDPTLEIDKSVLDALEIEGIQQAQKQLEENGQRQLSKYYCVGYSVVHYALDDAMIVNPLEHRGSSLRVDMIATFLPHSVVDSLYTVVDKLGLEVVNLTLEPIAAISVAIPEKFRLLNLALVDVGAGTSDIALTKGGAVFSYAMVDKAGDELTEALVQHYLLDFDSAERLKIMLSQSDEQHFCDVVGIEHSLPTQQILEILKPELNRVGEKIAQGIIEANGGTPSAVFLIGGGCQVPGFGAVLAEHLKLPKERVVIKSASQVEDIRYESEPFTGPEYITPLGIGYQALKAREQDFLQVHVNDTPIRLFNARQLSVADALILIGYNPRRLIPERGKSIAFTLNQKVKRVLGGYGEPAKVYVNGMHASLDTPIKHKDTIVIEPAVQGVDADITLSELVDFKKHIYFEGAPMSVVRDILVNGEVVDRNYKVKPQDAIEIKALDTVGDFMSFKQIDANQESTLMINGRQAHMDLVLKHGDLVTLQLNKLDEQSSTSEAQYDKAEKSNFENAKLQIYELVVNGEPLHIKTTKSSMIFVDIFEHYPFELSKPQGIIDLQLNGQRARYTDYLKSGDVITIGWRQ